MQFRLQLRLAIYPLRESTITIWKLNSFTGMCYRELSAGHVGGALFAVEVDVVVVLNPEILLTQPLVLVGVCEGYGLIDQVACLGAI